VTRVDLQRVFRLALVSGALLCASCVGGPSSTELAERNGKIELARQFVEASQHAKAVSILQELSRFYPNEAGVHYLYGLALMGLQDVRSAHDRFARAVELDKTLDDARLSLGYTKIVLKKYEEARRELSLILERGDYPYMERVHVNLGLIDLQLKRCDLALRSFDSAIEIDPTLATAYFNKGKCLVHLRKSQAALEAFDKAVKFCPGCSEPRLELAKTLVRLGRTKEASAALNEVLSKQNEGSTHSRARALMESMGQKNNSKPR
jgi:tetratricopeptide (TPR) repeat protein